jgi:pantoate kinase
MKNGKEEITVKVPHRLTGFFEIVDTEKGKKLASPERIGSRGAGISLSAMGKTTIKAKQSNQINDIRCNIYINGEKLNEKAETSYYIFNYFKELIKGPKQIEIYHEFELPVGCGYGASGSGALGLAYGLNKLFQLDLTAAECGRIAHISEVVNQTGLGTVCGLLCSGLCVLKEPGYPCTYERISVPENIRVICTSFGEIYTKSILSDEEFQLKIKKAGKIVLSKFLFNPNIKSFMNLSHEFIEKTQLLDVLGLEETKNLIKDLNETGIIGASMNQLGRSVFAVCRVRKVEEVLKVFERYQPREKIYNLRVYEKGIKINR